MTSQVRRLESEFFSLLQTAVTDTLLRSLDTFAQPIMLCDMGARGWPILHANAGWVKRLGARDPCICHSAVPPLHSRFLC